MPKELDILSDINKVKAPTDIYDNLRSMIDQSNVISLTWVRVTAAIFLLLFCFEIYLCKDFFLQDEAVSTESSIYEVADNQFYYD